MSALVTISFLASLAIAAAPMSAPASGGGGFEWSAWATGDCNDVDVSAEVPDHGAWHVYSVEGTGPFEYVDGSFSGVVTATWAKWHPGYWQWHWPGGWNWHDGWYEYYSETKDVSAIRPEDCDIAGTASLAVACGGSSLTFEAVDVFGWDFVVQYADESYEYFDLGGLVETFSYEFDQPIIWAGAWVYYWWAEDVYDFYDFIEATPVACPPTLEPLVVEYVYYSATGFFGDGVPGPYATNTLTIWSIQGEPTVPRRAFWAGGTLPEDYRLACHDWLYDDQAGGVFSCDAFLDSVGERRALLRDDPEGRDVLEPILRYLSWAAP